MQKIVFIGIVFLSFTLPLKTIEYSLVINGAGLKQIPPYIYTLHDLQKLDLSDNKIEFISSKINQLSSLKYLNLNVNKLNKFPVEIIALHNLKDLKLEENNITIIPKEIGEMTSLESLSFGSTHMGSNPIDSIPKEIGLLVNLKKLYLTDCPIKHLPKEIGDLKNLETLTLNNSLLDSIPLKGNKLLKLRTLHVYNSRFLTHLNIENLVQLEELSINGTQLRQLPTGIKNLKNLKFISLDYTLVPDFFEILEAFPYLEEIRIEGIKNISENKLQKTQKRHPYIEITGY